MMVHPSARARSSPRWSAMTRKQLKPITTNSRMPTISCRPAAIRGRQLQVLVEGTYYINRLFATVEMIHKTIIEVGNVGVVVSYTGETGADLSGAEYRHGELVSKGNRGVWSEPLLPGKYAFNTYAGKVSTVPTTNFILKWIRNEVGAHHFDENLTEVSLITKDAFEPSLPLSVVVHIDYQKAPLVIQRFGDIKRLVEQTLDPMVSAYFKNIGQTRTLIQLVAGSQRHPATGQPGNEGKVRPLQPGAGRSADRHTFLSGGRHADRDHPDPVALTPDRHRTGGNLRPPGNRPPSRNANCARPNPAPRCRPR